MFLKVTLSGLSENLVWRDSAVSLSSFSVITGTTPCSEIFTRIAMSFRNLSRLLGEIEKLKLFQPGKYSQRISTSLQGFQGK